MAASDGKIRRTIYLQDECAANLHAIARRTGTTIPQIITATAAIFLHRLIGETDLIIGLAAAARTRVSRRIPGMLANVLPLRLALHPGLSVSEVVGRTALQMRRGLRRQRFPFGDLRRDARALEDGRPVFALAVNIMPFDYSFRFADCEAIANNLSLGPVDDLAISVYDRSDGGPIRIDFDANPVRYEEADLADYQDRFLRLLAAAADPERPIGALDILSADERRTLLRDWNATARAIPAASLPELVAAQAARSAGRGGGGGRGGEPQLWRTRGARQPAGASSAAAGRRPGNGGRPVRRPLAGHGGWPARHSQGGRRLSAARPGLSARAARLHARRCARRVLVSEAALADVLPPEHAAASVLLDADAPAIAACPATPPPLALDPHHPAYVIYTSGSTGTPKGVVVTHAGIPSLVAAQVERFGITSESRVLQFASLSFDAAVSEIATVLASGAALVLLPAERSDDGAGAADQRTGRHACDPAAGAAGGAVGGAAASDIGRRRRGLPGGVWLGAGRRAGG